ncbi:MAG: hypothetical protein A2Y62_16410 [Candidatus Fischerbacteria bacterium RBG_13_37_8]|uniref:Flippase-like domain-containing protein n=1 Tax=Candidatus Fischerbacteria bacterium RBG_13_37_8 TaxID=1817863 RepID=A0A1F5VVQ6_9BACT|nr:MAG: hypothetical protein A2Y62_16410 [Candidatus Fischerbacteria bacterium RBG_13_37_8]
MNSSLKKKIYLLIKILISLSLLLLLFTLKININELLVILIKARYSYLFLALIPTALLIVIKAYKWQMLVNFSLEERVKYRESLFSLLYGLAPGLLTPGRAGEILRITTMSRFSKIKLAELFLVDKFIELSSLFLIAAVGSLILKFYGLFLTTFLLFVFSIALFNFRKTLFIPLLRVISKVVHRQVQILFQEIAFRHFLYYLLMSVAVLLLDIIAFYCIINALQDVNFTACMLAFPIILAAAVIPVSISGLGVREAAAVYVLSFFKVSPEVAFNASLLIFIVGSIIPAVAGQVSFLLSSKVKVEKRG